MAYRSLTQQSLHYFSRPQAGCSLEPIDSPAAWCRRTLDDHEPWSCDLSVDDIAELQAALMFAKQKQIATEKLEAKDFPLPNLDSQIAQWRHELVHGRGFMRIRGVPVDTWSVSDAEIAFWCLGLHMGIPGAQNPQGDLIGHVRDERKKTGGRYYQTNTNIDYHCDAADAVGLLCLKKAKEGGFSRITSSVSIYNELLRRRPDLIPALYTVFPLDAHGEGGIDYLPIEPCCYSNGNLRTSYHSDYFRSGASLASGPRLTAAQLEVLEVYEGIAREPDFYMDMDFLPGDIQLLSNHTQLHARTGYVDHDDPSERRHLLRLWLSLPLAEPLIDRWRRFRYRLALIYRVARRRRTVRQISYGSG